MCGTFFIITQVIKGPIIWQPLLKPNDLALYSLLIH